MDYISISTSNVIFSCLLRFYKCIVSNFHRVLQVKFFEIWFHIMKQQNTFAIIKKCVNKYNVPFYCFANIFWDHIPNVVYYSPQLLKVDHKLRFCTRIILFPLFFGEFTTHTSTHLHNHNNGFLQQSGNKNAMFNNKEVVTLIYQNLLMIVEQIGQRVNKHGWSGYKTK